MNIRRFTDTGEFEQAALQLLGEHFQRGGPGPHAVMLTGGRTPLGLYDRLQGSPCPVDDALHVLVSDERHVPPDSPHHNFAKMKTMLEALGLPPARILRVHTELAPEQAAKRYHGALAAFFANRGRITLGILGLGADGHLASLFTEEDARRGEGKFAVAVDRPDGLAGISVTRDLLLRIERLVFLVAGEEKAEIMQRIQREPASTIAGRVLRDAPSVEWWYHSLAR